MKNKKTIHSIIGIVIMLLGWLIPGNETVTALGWQVLFIFLGALYLWCSVELIWPSFLALLMLGLTDYGTVSNVIASAMSNSTVMLMFYMMLFASIANEAGLVDYISQKILSSKMLKGRPWILTGAIVFASLIGSALIDGVPAILICWSMIYEICKQVGYEKQDKWPSVAIVGVLFATCFGISIFPFKFTVVGTFGFAQQVFPELTYNYGGWLVLALVISVFACLLYLLICRFVVRPDISLLKQEFSVAQAERLSGRQKKALVLLIVLIVLVMFPSFLPDGNMFKTVFETKLGTVGITVFCIVLALLMRQDGESFVKFPAIAAKGIYWGVLIMSAAALTLAGALVSEDTGISRLFVEVLSPALSGISGTVFVFAAVFLTLIVTNMINNAIVMAVAVPLVCTLGEPMGLNLVAVTGLLVFSCTMALFLPSASPYGAMLHGNREWVSSKMAFQLAGITVLAALITLILAYPLAAAIM